MFLAKIMTIWTTETVTVNKVTQIYITIKILIKSYLYTVTLQLIGQFLVNNQILRTVLLSMSYNLLIF